MTPSRKPGFLMPVAVTVAVLLALYVGVYYWLVLPSPNFRQPHFSWKGLGSKPTDFDTFCQVVFAPIHGIDRRLRPHVWSLEE